VLGGETAIAVPLAKPFQKAARVADVVVDTDPAVKLNLADEEPAGMFTDDGAGSTAVLDDVSRTVAALGATAVRKMVQVTATPDVADDGQTSFDRATTAVVGVTDTVVIWLVWCADVVMVADVVVETGADVAVNVAEPRNAVTVTEDGTLSAPEDDASVTAVAVGTSCAKVTVQTVFVPDAIDDGEQVTLASGINVLGETDTGVVLVTPFQAAETVAELTDVTDPAVVVKLTDFAPAGTTAEDGTGSAAEEDARVTVVLLVAAALRETEHDTELPETTEDGEQLTPDRTTAVLGEIDTEVVLVAPPHAAETVAEVFTLTEPEADVKLAEVDPAGIDIDEGTGSEVEDDVRATVTVLVAAPLSATVHVVDAPETTEAGEQLTPERLTVVLGETDTEVVLVTPLQAAESVTVLTVVTEAAMDVKVAELAPDGTTTDEGAGRAAEDDERDMVVLL